MSKVRALYVKRDAYGRVIGVKDVWEPLKGKEATPKEKNAIDIARHCGTIDLDLTRMATQVLSREIDLADRFRSQLAKAKGKLS